MARSRQYPTSVDPGAPIEPPTPNGWKRFMFGDLFEVVERPVVLNDEAEYQLVNAKRSRGGIAPRDRLRGRDIKVKSQYRIETNDFLVSRRQIIHGACGVVPKELAGAVVSNEYAVLCPKPSLSIEYLRHLSATSYFQRTCFHSSVGVDVEKMIFKLDQWFRYFVPIPPLAEQRKIASILSSVDDTIEKTQAVADQLGVVKKGLLGELLKRGMPGRHKSFRKTEIGLLPAGWGVGPIAEIGTVVTGSTPSTKNPSFWGGVIPFVTPGDLGRTKHVLAVERTVTEEGAQRGRMLPEGAVLMTCIGATIGKHGIVRARCLANQQINAVVCNEKMDPDFLFYALATSAEKLRAIAGTTAVPIVSKGKYEQFVVPVPELAEQREIAASLDLLDQAINGNRAALEEMRRVRAGLLKELLSGKLRVSVTRGSDA
jgi:type I restriction enzyme S subunit